jgi:hypothetical protein
MELMSATPEQLAKRLHELYGTRCNATRPTILGRWRMALLDHQLGAANFNDVLRAYRVVESNDRRYSTEKPVTQASSVRIAA